MAQKLKETAKLNLKNAVYLATASLLVYDDDPGAFATGLGLAGEFCNQDGTQVFVGNDDTNLVIAFRGSEPLLEDSEISEEGIRDWLFTDTQIRLTRPVGKLKSDFNAIGGASGEFHRGFLKALTGVWSKVKKKIKDDPANEGRRIWLTGHSLGGALAALAVCPLDRLGYNVHNVYTFASPMVCNNAAATRIDLEFPNLVHRFVFERDIVPSLPFWGFPNEYTHVKTLVALDKNGVAESAQGLRLLNAFVLAAGAISGSLADLIWQAIQDRIDAHSLLDSYLPALKRAAG